MLNLLYNKLVKYKQVQISFYLARVDNTRATMSPYRPSTSAKMRIRIIPTNSRGCCAVPLTPESPTIPIAKPAARPLKPTERPAPSWRKELQKERKEERWNKHELEISEEYNQVIYQHMYEWLWRHQWDLDKSWVLNNAPQLDRMTEVTWDALQ